MSPETFYRSTLREVSHVIRGAQFRQEQRARGLVIGAHLTASLVRCKRMPRVESLLRERQQRAESQTAEQKRAFLVDWAHKGQRQGLAIRMGRLDQPFALEGPTNG